MEKKYLINNEFNEESLFNNLICKYCYKHYSNISNLRRHIKNDCIIKKIKEKKKQ